MKSLAIITARGGSKRIPRKNIKEFCGKAIIVYSIEAALNSGAFDEVMVSTDDKEIAQIAVNAGAVVPFMRSDSTANDHAGTDDQHCCRYFDGQNAGKGIQHEDREVQQQREAVHYGFFPKAKHRLHNEHAHTHADPGKSMLNDRQVRKIRQKCRDHENDEDGSCEEPGRCAEGADHTPLFLPDKS